MRRTLLLVRHGPGRGRLPDFHREPLRHISRWHPELAARIRLHRTGAGSVSLDGVGAVAFWLADPLRERYPDCFREAAEIHERAESLGLPVLNPPAALSNTVKSRQGRLWDEAGLPAATGHAFESREELESALTRTRYPAFVRPDLLHTEARLHLLRRPSDAETLPEDEIVYPGTVLPFVDVRDGYRSTLPDTAWARLYHKKRAVVIGERVLPFELYFSTEPFVRRSNCVLRRYDAVNDLVAEYPRWDARLGLSWRLQRLMPLDSDARAMVEHERAFVNAAPERPETLRRAVRTLGLDYAAIDYATLADGSLFLWEANPYPRVPPWHREMLPARRSYRDRTERLYDAIADHFRELLAGGTAPARGTTER